VVGDQLKEPTTWGFKPPTQPWGRGIVEPAYPDLATGAEKGNEGWQAFLNAVKKAQEFMTKWHDAGHH
jgi:hypothetical protein